MRKTMTLAAGTTGKGLIKQVQKALGERSPAAQLVPLLYGNGFAGFDFSPARLADEARAVLEFIAEKPERTHKLRIRSVHGPDGPAEGSVVEILNDDMPFLVDSVMGELQARSLPVRFLLHPIFKTRRDEAGRLRALVGPGDQNWGDGHQESYIAIYLQPMPEARQRDLAVAISGILGEVRAAVTDWQAMLAQLRAAIAELEAAPGVPADDRREATQFLRWLEAGHFTFLGGRTYELDGTPETGSLVAAANAGLGVLRDAKVQVLRRGTELVELTPEVRRFYFAPAPLIVTKSSVVSRVHRRVHMDYIGVKTYRRDGTVGGEIRIVGLFTSRAYTGSARDIPMLRRKVDTVLKKAGHPPSSHAGKALVNVLETFPRDELFQIDADELAVWSDGILDLELRPRVRVFARTDRFDRFVSVLVYTPRDRYSSSVRERIAALLADAYKGRVVAFYPYFTDTPLVRVQFIVARYEGATPKLATAELERGIADIVRTWDDRLVAAVGASGARGEALLAKYRTAFSAAYTETFSAERALADIERIERLGPDLPVAIDFYREQGEPPGRCRAAVYRFGGPISLSQRVPVLEHLGFVAIDESSYELNPRFAEGERLVTLHDMAVETADGSPVDLAADGERLEACFLAVFRGEADNDGFNRLVISAGADWRSVAALRACAAYLRQLGSPFGPRYIAETLNRHAGLARDLLELFHLRFDPDRRLAADARKTAEEPIRRRIEGALAAVPSLDEDRILRQVLNLIGAMLRTNFFQTAPEGRPPPTISFKFDGKAVDAAPQPRPFREIWVYSPRVEGIHLRFAPIARGGIRWSDRAQDFRTEILGLVRAQLVKNAVIVPSGAKGGFLPKQLPRSGSREEVQKEGVASYRTFVSALLDLTDNLKDGRIVPPPRVVRHDGDDPYLVVAADKGTATFSDIANEISLAHDFWLGDAFASGGSAGYDHKRMGITARGAWECVERHFREMDIDIGRQAFRVVGVGDMSGDVFGNGMLLSEHIRLLAAFDHRDIVIDPDPDAAAGFAERKRLFALPRSSWQDYDRTSISRGGGIFSRSAKAIPVSAEMKALLGLDAASVTPPELIRAVLRCRTDLLWFGGIGTYVRASGERDEEVGDRANDAVRVAASELRAKVVGEGANLGVTQRGRIEFAQRGGRIDTDFIDNSAGVNTSDQEVNIKIAMQAATRAGTLGAQARLSLLADMTGDVAAASLRNNYQQSLALSLAERRSTREIFDYALLMRELEARGLLDRALEALPSEMEMQERGRAGRGLTRPELAVLLSYAKIALQHDILESRVPDEPQLEGWLVGYFPPILRERFRAGIDGHSLRREIVALGLTNAVVNRGGPAMAVRIAAETRRPASEVAHAFMAVREVFDLSRLWQGIDALDGKVGGEVQLALYEATRDLLNELTPWFLRREGTIADLSGTIARHRAGLAAVTATLEDVLPPRRKGKLAREAGRLAEGGVPADLAGDIARLEVLTQAPAITEIAESLGEPVPKTARLFFAAGERLGIDDLARGGAAIATTDRYDRLAIAQVLDQLAAAQAAFTGAAIAAGGWKIWSSSQKERIARVRQTLDEAAGASALTLARLMAAAAALTELAARAR